MRRRERFFETEGAVSPVARPGGGSPVPGSSRKRGSLVAAIHDVSPRFESAVDRLADLFEQAIGGPRFAMLVVPNHWGESPLWEAPAYRTKLRRWAERGVEMFVHGWYHRDDCQHSGIDRFRSRRLTAGEGEFLGLSRAEASARMARGRAVIEDAIGQEVAGFVAPAWLYGDGAREALAESRFGIAEDHFRVWRPHTGQVLARGPVVTWASRSRLRAASSVAFAGIARTGLLRWETVRMAVHPGDVTSPPIMRSIERTLAHFTAARTPQRYADLLARSGDGSPQAAASA